MVQAGLQVSKTFFLEKYFEILKHKTKTCDHTVNRDLGG